MTRPPVAVDPGGLGAAQRTPDFSGPTVCLSPTSTRPAGPRREMPFPPEAAVAFSPGTRVYRRNACRRSCRKPLRQAREDYARHPSVSRNPGSHLAFDNVRQRRKSLPVRRLARRRPNESVEAFRLPYGFGQLLWPVFWHGVAGSCWRLNLDHAPASRQGPSCARRRTPEARP